MANHLWQSTLFLAIVALLAVALRKNRAHVRYWLWLSASAKFLIPFAALVTLGNQFGWRSSEPIVRPILPLVVGAVSQPFSSLAPGVATAASAATPVPGMLTLPVVLLAIWCMGCGALLMMWFARWRRVAATVREASIVESGRELEVLRRIGGGRLRLLASDASLEPGVFGILRPVLLWPRSIGERLSDEQIVAILAHELAHVRRRDNLAAAMHMLVQAVFWFHPLVWWVGARLIDERERACDEEVIRQGSQPQVYAESILKTCEFYIESPLACLSGVTGSDLKKRIEQIMRNDVGFALNAWRKLVLAIVGVVAIGGPVLVGVLNAPRLGAQSAAAGAGDPAFEVASIKVNKSGNAGGGSRFEPGGRFTATNITLRTLIGNAYGAPLQPLLNSQLVGGPDWIDSEHFDIVAKAEGNVPPGPDSRLPLMVRALLAERFKLAVHNETRELPIYALVMARSDRRIGERIKPSAIDCRTRGRGNPLPAPPPPGERPSCGIRFLIGNMAGGGVTMAQFASALSRFVGRPVVEKTELSGGFDIDLKWTPDRLPSPPPAGAPFQPPIDPDGPSIFTAVQEQLGLKLDPQNGPIDVLVIDRVERLNAEDEFVSPPPPPLPPPPPPR
ncbi:MAG TPA: M56 and DUF3738 domain-containing protein [Vicinamibacterales bacterium]|jgi:uncharacterized protein (TIGR03435 family)